MDRATLEVLSADNPAVDLAEVIKVQEELSKLVLAGFAETEGYAISPPLGGPVDVTQTQTLANAQPGQGPTWKLGLTGR